ncbi:MAG TPA: DNA primase [Desulfobacteraceae bacterium]|nr:DNA primase [Desulfobacteraceae bacterium]
MGEVVSIKEKVEARVKEVEDKTGSGSGDGIDTDFVLRCLGRNELGDGELFKKLYRDRYVFNKSMDGWMEWLGHIWAVDKKNARTLAAVEGVAEIYGSEASKLTEKLREVGAGSPEEAYLKARRDALLKRVSALRARRRRKNCLHFASSTHNAIAIDGKEIDQKAWLFPCLNGVINLKTGELEPGRPGDYLMKTSPVEWLGIDKECEIWEKSLLEIFSDNYKLVAFLQRVCGAALVGEVLNSIMVVMTGRGRNGKSLIVDVMSDIMGDLAQPIRSEMLLDQYRIPSASSPTPDIMKLRGLRMAFASETDDGCKISPSKVKWLTGKDKLTGRGAHETYEVTFRPSHTLFLLTNHKPHAPAEDFAFWERMVLFPFEISFVDRDPDQPHERRADVHLGQKLEKEYSGILAWMVRGCLDWQKEGLAPPTAVKEAVKEYRRDEDSVADFIDERCVVGLSYKVTAAAVYADFEEWWKVNVSNRVPKKKRFGTWFGKRFERVKRGTIWYEGVGLLAEQEQIRDMVKD